MALILVPSVIVALTAAFVVASLGWDGKSGIVGGFADVERDHVRSALGDTRQAMDRDLDALDATTRDWAHWNDTYDFVQGEFPEYVEIDLAPISFVAYDLSFMLYLDDQGEVVYASGFDPATETYTPFPPGLASQAGRDALGLPLFDDEDGHVRGIIGLSDGAHFVSSWAVLDSAEEGPVAGTLTWGRRIDGDYTASLANSTEQELELILWEAASGRDAAAADRLDGEGETSIQDRGDHLLVGYTRVDDLVGDPALLVRLDEDRPIRAEAYESLTFAYIAAVVVVFLFVAVVLVLMRRFVTGRVRTLAGRMEDMRTGGSRHPAEIVGTDEVADLARNFDALVQDLDRRTKELEASNADLKRFASVVSHDLKSPLTTFLLTLSVLRKDADERKDTKSVENLARLERNATSMAERINAILDYSRAAQAPIPDEQVDLRAVMDDMVGDLAAEIEASKATVQVRPLPTVRGSADQLKQVMQNLVHNAIKYARPGEPPRISVLGYETSYASVVEVTDNGLGFETADVRDMFTPFRRLDRTKAIPGHGVGLATVARIMQRHGGHVEAKGELGKGSTFTLVFPRARDAPRPAATAPGTWSPTGDAAGPGHIPQP